MRTATCTSSCRTAPLGMTPPDFVYELRKIDTQGQLVGAIRLIQPPIYASARRQLRSRSDYRPRAGQPRLRLRDRLRRVAGHHHADRERADVVQAVGQRLPRSAVRHLLRRVPPEDRHHDADLRDHLRVLSRRHPGRSAVRRRLGSVVVRRCTSPARRPRRIFRPRPGHTFPAGPQFGQKRVPRQAGSRRSCRRSSFDSARSSPDTSPIDVAVLPGGMTAVVGQATDFELRHLALFPPGELAVSAAVPSSNSGRS